MIINYLFAAEDAHAAESASGLGALGINPAAFLIQLGTFVIVFFLLKKFAFAPIVRLLEERRKTIEDGVKMGQRMAKEREKLDEEVAAAMRDARHEADKIIATGHKEAREVIREAEKAAHTRAEHILADAEARIHEDTATAKRKLEKDIVGLVSEATEAIVGEKVDAKKDAEIIDKALKGRR
jgi:F-type H+-transporting ATPase subunit b